MTTATGALSRAALRVDDRVRVAGLVAVTFAALALLAHGAPGPRVFPDEIIYMDAAASLADGDGLAVRGRTTATGRCTRSSSRRSSRSGTARRPSRSRSS